MRSFTRERMVKTRGNFKPQTKSGIAERPHKRIEVHVREKKKNEETKEDIEK